MAILTWTTINNGDSLGLLRPALNTFQGNVVTNVNINTADILTNAGNISSNTAAIATNVIDIATNASDILAVDSRVTAIENSHSVIISAFSIATIQQPTVVDVPIQIEFGALQTTTDISLSALGAFTFNVAGKYILSLFFQYGRTGSTGTSELLNRYLINGAQIGNSLVAKIDNADTLVPWSSSLQVTVNANDVLTIEVMRDSAGNNSGGLFSVTPTVGTWNIAPCASIQIFKAM